MAAPKAASGSTALAKPVASTMQLSTPGELYALADMLYRGGLAPAGIDNPNKVAAVILAGLEVGLAPTQALGSIMLTNGRLSIYGDGALALVRASGQLESIAEKVEGEGPARAGTCEVKRKGEPSRVFQFSMGEAEKAGLIERAKGKGPWATYPDRMLIMRARGFALRDVFPDVLRGLLTYEEMADTPQPPVQATVISATPNHALAPQLCVGPPCETTQNGPPVIHQAETVAAGPPMVTNDQLAKISEIRGMVCVSRNLKDAGEQKAAWAELLASYKVTSAREFTQEQATAFIETEWKKNDPFGSASVPPATPAEQPSPESTSPPSSATATT